MDEVERKRALDPRKSFIVEAPAGSGKTELLTMRYLTLLCTVHKDPEEIIALTFTRKAASEMRHRIISAIKQAIQIDTQEAFDQLSSVEQARVNLAQKVLERDRKSQWHLIQNPNRLRILTIDALCAMLSYRSPILSNFGGKPQIHDYPKSLYLNAVQDFIEQTDNNCAWRDAFEHLLIYFDNLGRLTDWLVQLLSNRDQWMPMLYLHRNQENIEVFLQQTVNHILTHEIQSLCESFEPIATELQEMIPYLGQQLLEVDEDHPFCQFQMLYELPAQPENISFWLAMSDLFLTNQGQWRKSVTKKQGFLSPSSANNKEEKEKRKHYKARFMGLIEDFKGHQSLMKQLHQLRTLPMLPLDVHEVRILQSLQTILPILNGFLNLHFKEAGKVDFIETSLGASFALKDEIGPTDVAMIMDYKISHLLVDEFQDTSNSQFDLIERLVSEWDEHSGKTIFLVGDPQQSIYRFRGAEVGVFLHAKEMGVGNIRPESIVLKRNFRTSESVLTRIGDVLKKVFPIHNNLSTGAVTYKQAFSAVSSQSTDGVFVNCFQKTYEEDRFILEKIQTLCKEDNTKSIAILVRARSQLVNLLALLRSYELPYHAKEIKQICALPQVIDLIALMKATYNWSDRIAWLSILRAPWLGLSLNDLYAIVENETKELIWQSIQTDECLAALSEQGKTRLKPFIVLMQFWFQQRYRKPINEWLNGLWHALNGPSCYPYDVTNEVDQVFGLLNQFIDANGLIQFDAFEEKLLSIYVDQRSNQTEIKNFENKALTNTTSIQLMTIHQAKGLEFDYVFLPNLEKSTSRLDSAILNWHEGWYGNEKLFLMGAKTTHSKHGASIYDYVNSITSDKNDYELIRLLYVAMTRAKNKLFLTFSLASNEQNEPLKPRAGSFLALIYHYLDEEEKAYSCTQAQLKKTIIDVPFIYRSSQAIDLNKVALTSSETTINVDESNPLNRPVRAQNHIRLAGIVFHRLIAGLFQSKQKTEMASALNGLKERVPYLIKRFGLSAEHFQETHNLITEALENIFQDPKGQWILDLQHQNRLSEKGFSFCSGRSKSGQAVKHMIFDCAFTDQDNQWWIIDFKLTQAKNLEATELKNAIEQYKIQLTQYKKALMAYTKAAVKTALYFPTMPKWYEV